MQGVKGASAYAEHAYRLAKFANLPLASLEKCSEQLFTVLHYFQHNASMATALDRLMELGQINFKITEILDEYNCKVCGVPRLVSPNSKLVPGKCVLITGHDLVDLTTLVAQAEKRKINVYTNGEMLPALAYPELNKHPNLIGNYGHAWWKQ